jgi:hypothetical protein
VACGRLRSADIVTLDTVALFGLSEVPGDQPAGTHVTSGDAIDRAEVRAGAEPPQLAAEQVGPLGGTVGAPATVAESNSSDQGAAPNTTASKG